MPKAKSVRRKPRPSPYSKKSSKSNWVATAVSSPLAHKLGLLTIPREIRDNIYSYFTKVPKDNTCLYSENDEATIVLKTRKALLSVCHQISEEWAPTFYRSTVIEVSTLKPNAPRKWVETLQKYRAIDDLIPNQHC